MKLTKTQLKQLLKEEITKVFETHGGLERAASLVRDPENPMAKGYERPSHSYEQVMDLVAKFIEGMSEEEALDWAKELIGDPERPYSGFMKTAERPLDLEKLKEVIKEELEALMREMEAPDGTTSAEVAAQLKASGVVITDRLVDNAVAEAGVFDDDGPDFAAEVWEELEELGYRNPDEEPLRLHAPDFDPLGGMPSDWRKRDKLTGKKKAPMSRAWKKRYPHLADPEER